MYLFAACEYMYVGDLKSHRLGSSTVIGPPKLAAKKSQTGMLMPFKAKACLPLPALKLVFIRNVSYPRLYFWFRSHKVFIILNIYVVWHLASAKIASCYRIYRPGDLVI